MTSADAAFPWVQDGDGLRCTRHDVRCSPVAPCPACMSDPPPETDEVDAPFRAPEGCESVLQHEQWFTGLAGELGWMAREVFAKGERSPKAAGASAKLYSEAIKARRQAAELARWREDEESVRRLRRERARMRGGDAH